MDKRPIGIFDSGTGGLTVAKEIIKIFPNEDIVYLGDTARIPYGTRSKETVIKFSFEDAHFLLKKKVKCIVIACNTSSALAGNELKNKLKTPIFEVITPALKDARKISKTGKIGVIGTRGTIGSGAYKVPFSVACPLLVPFIEEAEIKNEAIKIVIKNYLEPLKGKIDTLILGCTHYPIIENLIQKEIGEKVKLVNPGKSISVVLKDFLVKSKMQNGQTRVGKKEYYVTDLTDRFTKVAEIFLGKKLDGKIKKVNLE